MLYCRPLPEPDEQQASRTASQTAMAPKRRAPEPPAAVPRTRAARKAAGQETALPADLFNLKDPEPPRKRRRRANDREPAAPAPVREAAPLTESAPPESALTETAPTAPSPTERPPKRSRRVIATRNPSRSEPRLVTQKARPSKNDTTQNKDHSSDKHDEDDLKDSESTHNEIYADGDIPATARIPDRHPPNVDGRAVGPIARASALWKTAQAKLLQAVLQTYPHTLEEYGNLTWSRALLLGEGSYGIAHVFALRDAHGNIKDAEVVKDCLITEYEWALTDFWHPAARSPDRKPAEIAILEDIRKQQTAQHPKYCSHLRRAIVNLEAEFFRIHMDYCQLGDLYNVVTHHMAAHERIAEPAIWAIFDALTNALLLMAYGSHDELNQTEDWKKQSIIHRDLKLENVFLAENTSSIFPSFPTPVIGDFGISIRTNDDDPSNPKSYNCNSGTKGWQPPEMLKMYRIRSMKPWDEKLTEKTNIWGVGAIIIRLMLLQLQADHDYVKHLNNKKMSAADRDPSLRVSDAKDHYSPELCRLAERCCRAEPRDRIGLGELRKAIDRHTGALGSTRHKDLANGGRHGRVPGVVLRTSPDQLLHRLAELEQR